MERGRPAREGVPLIKYDFFDKQTRAAKGSPCIEYVQICTDIPLLSEKIVLSVDIIDINRDVIAQIAIELVVLVFDIF